MASLNSEYWPGIGEERKLIFKKKLLDILENHPDYTLEMEKGQRIFQNPSTVPAPNTEVFIGHLPNDLFEDELIPFLERVGRVVKLRMMINFSGECRGFAFASFSSPNIAIAAVKLLNEEQIRLGKKIIVKLSLDNKSLYIGNLPRNVTSEDIRRELRDLVEGITQIKLYEDLTNKGQNRGYGFIEFDEHRNASIAKTRLGHRNLKLWGVDIIIDWANPKPVIEPQDMKNLNRIFIRNLDVEWKECDLMFELSKHVPTCYITRLKKIQNFCFVHFINKDVTEKALASLQGTKILGKEIEVNWAIPKKYQTKSQPPDHCCTSVPPGTKRYIKMLHESRNKSNLINVQPPNRCL